MTTMLSFTEIRGAPIIAPVDVLSRVEPILISSKVYQNEIERQIRGDLKAGNELSKLY